MNWPQVRDTLLAGKGSLQFSETASCYNIFIWDGPRMFGCEIFKEGYCPAGGDEALHAEWRTEFEADYKSDADKVLAPKSVEGIPQTNSIPATDPHMACYCPSVSGNPTPAAPSIDIEVTDTYWQMQGMVLDTEGAAPGDSILFKVGMMVGGSFVTVSAYGKRIYVRASDHFDHTAPIRSNPIPSGLLLRWEYVFVNPSSPSTPFVSVQPLLWRPYA